MQLNFTISRPRTGPPTQAPTQSPSTEAPISHPTAQPSTALSRQLLEEVGARVNQAPPRPDYLLWDDTPEVDPDGNQVIVDGVPVRVNTHAGEFQIETMLHSDLWTVNKFFVSPLFILLFSKMKKNWLHGSQILSERLNLAYSVLPSVCSYLQELEMTTIKSEQEV